MGNSTLADLDPRTATASHLQALLQSSSLTSVQLVQLYTRQIEACNGYLHAVISNAPASLLLGQASRLDGERAQGRVRSSMHGIPILIKDNIATHPDMGMDTTAGSFALAGSRPKKSADLVEKVRFGGVAGFYPLI